MIVYAEVNPELAELVRAMHKPLVLVDSVVSGANSVRCQDHEGARLAMAHALAARPDQVLVLSFPLDALTRSRLTSQAWPAPSGTISGERIAGYVAAAREAGFPLERLLWVEVDDHDPDCAAALMSAAKSSCAARCRLAVVAMSDRMALAAQAAMADWTSPRVVALVGFDDIEAAAGAGLTTIRQNHQLKGQRAVQALLDGLKPRPLPIELIVRST
jgi:DNA-binding LacI/PurR family transcriptional regulator